jgi:hypothetical protein
MDSVESAMGHVMLNLCFCIRWDMWVMQCILVHPGGGCETSTGCFSCSGRTGTDSTKSASGHITLNLCFCMQYGF